MDVKIPVFVLIVIICHVIARPLEDENVPNVHLQEEIYKGYEITNIHRLFNIESTPNQRFKILSQKLAISNNGIVFNKRMKSEQDFVRLNARNGKLTLVKKIDRDEVCGKAKLCAVKLQIIELPAQQLLEMNLVVDDINDNYPIFPQKIIDISLHENFPIGETYNLDAYLANDKDSAMNGKLQYTLTENPKIVLQEWAGNEGYHLQIQLIRSLDYEDAKEISLTLMAHDGGMPAKSSSTTLRITIVDVNDNKPLFEQEKYTVTLKENQLPGHEVVTVQADDADSGDLGQVQYYLSHRNNRHVMQLVSVHPQTGVVTLNEKLDRERDDGVRVIIAAKDSAPSSGERTGETYLIINVEDVNDNAPVIHLNYVVSSDKNTAYVNENSAIGTYLLRVTVTDADKDVNGDVSVVITSSKIQEDSSNKSEETYFKLNSNAFIETATELNREECNEYVVTITACDQGREQRCSSLTLDVVVLDVNEYAPKFDVSTQRVVLREDVNVGITVASVHAEDRDAINGASLTTDSDDSIVPAYNGLVTYNIIDGGRGVFEIDQESGRISLVRQLDREVQSEWKLKVLASDGGTPEPRKTSCDVIIKVHDVNDNSPIFMNPSVNNSLVYATTSHDELITTFKAEDKDINENSKLQYKLLLVESDEDKQNQPFMKSSFILNPTTGDLRLNFTKINVTHIIGLNNLHVQVCDSGTPKLCSAMLLRVVVGTHVSGQRLSEASFGFQNILLLVGITGGVALVLVATIAVVILRCRKKRKQFARERRNTKYNSRSEYSLEKDDHEPSRVSLGVEDESSIKRFQQENPEALDPETEMEMKNETSPTHGGNTRFLFPQANSKKISANSDGDSGRGDSEPDNAYFQAIPHNNDAPKRVSMCQGAIRVLSLDEGHAGSTSSVSTVRDEKFYNWDKMKPRYYQSPPRHAKGECRTRYSASELIPNHHSHYYENFMSPTPESGINRRYSTAVLPKDMMTMHSSNQMANYETHSVRSTCNSTCTENDSIESRLIANNPSHNQQATTRETFQGPSGVLGKFGRSRRGALEQRNTINELLV